MATKQDTRSKAVKPITEEILALARKRFDYNPDTGAMVWKVSPIECRCVYVGMRAGTVDARGYKSVFLMGVGYKVHRLAYALVHGPILGSEGVDHINGDRTDNRASNLRLASQGTNCENLRSPRKDNKSGYLGVYKYWTKWAAKIQVDKRPIFLGAFGTPEAAHQAYLEAKRKYHEGCTI